MTRNTVENAANAFCLHSHSGLLEGNKPQLSSGGGGGSSPEQRVVAAVELTPFRQPGQAVEAF